MEWKIPWETYTLDEIGLVYEKAEAEPIAADMLGRLETLALSEVRACVDASPGVCSFDEMTQIQKETVLCLLGQVGIEDISLSFSPPVINIRLSARLPAIQGCTFFNILNRIEKLDGSFNERFPRATLHLFAPLGGKRGLMQWEAMIATLYPWLSVQESSTNAIADGTPPRLSPDLFS